VAVYPEKAEKVSDHLIELSGVDGRLFEEDAGDVSLKLLIGR
jgi:hypothetical protein